MGELLNSRDFIYAVYGSDSLQNLNANFYYRKTLEELSELITFLPKKTTIYSRKGMVVNRPCTSSVIASTVALRKHNSILMSTKDTINCFIEEF